MEPTFSWVSSIPELTTFISLLPAQLDQLWVQIGWKPPGPGKWTRSIVRASYVLKLTIPGSTPSDPPQLIGFGRIVEDGRFATFYDIAIHPDYQGKGYGTKLMNLLIDKVKDGEYADIFLLPWEGNPNNVPFYRKCGFVGDERLMRLEKYCHPE